MKLKKQEIGRQVIHILFGLAIIIGILNSILNASRVFLLLILCFVLSVISIKYKVPVVSWFLRNFERKEHLHIFPGKGFIFFLAGVLLVMKLFNQNIALAAIMILTFGDSVSHLVGKGIGKIRFPLNGFKNLEGIIVGVIVGGIGASFFVSVPAAFFGSLIGMGVEAVGIKMGSSDVDDNVIVPLVSGTAIYLFNTGFSIFI